MAISKHDYFTKIKNHSGILKYSTIPLVVGVIALLLSLVASQIARAAVPALSPGAYNYLYYYDNYNPNLGSPLNSNPQCYYQSPIYPDGTFVNAPSGTPYLSADWPWISVINQPTVDTVNVTPNTTVPLHLQINAVNMACQLVSKGTYFPSDTSLSDQDWFNDGEAVPYSFTQLVSNPTVVSGGGTVSLPSGNLQSATYANDKYWVANTLPLDYTPPGSNFNTFSNTQVIKVTANSQALAEFHNQNGSYNYSCVGGSVNQNIDHNTFSVGTVTSYPGGIGAFIQANCTLYQSNLNFTFTVIIPNNATCTVNSVNGVAGSSASVPAGSSFNVNFSMANPNDSLEWVAPSYKISRSFNGTTSSLDMPAPFYLSGTSFTYTDTLTAPVLPVPPSQTYQLNYQMEQNGTTFGGTCSFAITVRRLFNYVPKISITGTSTKPVNPTALLPADSAAVTPGETIYMQEIVKNVTENYSTPYGEQYNWWIDAYSGPYVYSASPTVNFGSDSVVASGPGAALAAGADSSNLCEVTPGFGNSGNCAYTVPAGALDGTQICFYAGVSPAQRRNVASDAYSVGSAYTNYSNSNNDDQNANIRSSLVAGVATPNDMCVEVENIRTLSIAVTQGDVHAGGGVGASCNLGPNSTGIFGDYGSYAQYVASSNAAITGLPTGGNGTTNGLTLGNVNPGSLGAYGIVCRPDMAANAQKYINSNGVRGVLAAGSYSLTGLQGGIYTTTGPVQLSGVVNAPITIYDPNGNGVTVTGNITYNSTPVGVNSLPSFGVITNGGNIYFKDAATQIDGFYVAQKNNGTGGVINTCIDHTLGNTYDCPDTLTVLGSLTANSFDFYRTSNSTFKTGNLVTESIQQSGLLYLAPPPAFATQPNTPAALPIYLGEEPPLY